MRMLEGVDGFEDFGKSMRPGGVGEGKAAKLVEGVGDLVVVVVMVGIDVGAHWVRKRAAPAYTQAYTPFVRILLCGTARVAVRKAYIGLVSCVGPFVEAARFASVEGALDPFGVRSLRGCPALSVGVGVVGVGVAGERCKVVGGVGAGYGAVGNPRRSVAEGA